MGFEKFTSHSKIMAFLLIRSIIAHTNSLLPHTAQFINHILQPLVQQYNNYIKNSMDLFIQLEEFTSVAEEIVLVTICIPPFHSKSALAKRCLSIQT